MTPRPGADLGRLHALVPLRGLADGKARLGGAIDAEERETLLRGLLFQTLDVLLGWPPCRQIHLVTRDRDVLASVAALALDTGVVDGQDTPRTPIRILLQEGEGLNAALVSARDDARAEGATAVLMLPVDLPLLTTESLDLLLEAADAAVAAGSGGPVVVVVPSDARGGTNALLLSPPDIVEPSFGIASLEAHLRAAARSGASLQVVHDPRLGFDLDTPEDLERLDPDRLEALTTLGAAPLAARPG